MRLGEAAHILTETSIGFILVSNANPGTSHLPPCSLLNQGKVACKSTGAGEEEDWSWAESGLVRKSCRACKAADLGQRP